MEVFITLPSMIKEDRDLHRFMNSCMKYPQMAKQIQHNLNLLKNEKDQEQGHFYQELINACLDSDQIKKDEFLQSFLGRSKDMAYKNFTMKKKSGGRYKQNSCCKLGSIFDSWKKREISIYQKGIAYRNQSSVIRQFLPFDHGFEYYYGKPSTSHEFGIVLVANHRQLHLEALNIKDFILFLYILKKTTQQSCYMSLNRFNSFSPIRYHNRCKYFVDGEEYFEALAESIERSQKSIAIMGWMISPQFLLRRKINKQQSHYIEFQELIQSATKRNVKVSIILYYQSSFLCNDSLYAKEKLQSISSNITVLRHPVGKIPVLWSHHGKLVIIDEKEAFIGGLDICYGRFDDQKHSIFDHQGRYPGIEYNNIRKKDDLQVRDFKVSSIERHECRLPWHDVSQWVEGSVVNDFVHHFNQFWHFVKYQTQHTSPQHPFGQSLFQCDAKSVFSTQQISKQQPKKQKGILQTLTTGFENIKSAGIKKWSNLIKKQQAIGRVKINHHQQNYFSNYLSRIRGQIEEKKKTEEIEIVRSKSNRKKRSNKIKRFSVDYVKEVISIKDKQGQSRRESGLKQSSSFLLSGNRVVDFITIDINHDYVECLQKVQKTTQVEQINDLQYQSDQDDEIKLIDIVGEDKNQQKGMEQCQVIRSVGNWSIGCHPSKTQFSIHIAYLQLISQAKHYIYIQNQFFISSTANEFVKNEIGNAIFKRIAKAIKENEQFRVYILLPLLPGFSGNLDTQECLLLRREMQWQYDTILRSDNSLLKMLFEITNDPFKYVQFLSLRNHGRYNSQSPPKTQIIYLHSKILIIDDDFVLCGSANINDRSMLGNRDSQIALVTHGDEFVQGVMGGEQVIVSQIAQELRIRLWRQHFGLEERQCIDPISDETWKKIGDIANNNTKIYRQLFGCYPDDLITNRRKFSTLQQNCDIDMYDIRKDEIKGHVVEFPLQFLSEERSVLMMIDKEFYMPAECLT